MRKIAENYKLPYYTLSPTYSVCREHGYLVGEQYTCPHCGQATEVYSRITGYYRPVQNWNDGKLQEYKERKVYDIGASRLTHTGPETEERGAEPAASGGEPLLFTTKTCPNCRLAVSALERAGISFRRIDAEEQPDLARASGVKQAPTLVVPVAGGGAEVYANASNIKGYAEGCAAHV